MKIKITSEVEGMVIVLEGDTKEGDTLDKMRTELALPTYFESEMSSSGRKHND